MAMPGLWRGMTAVLKRDLLLAFKRPGDVLNPLVFFAIVSTLFPLAIGPASEQLLAIGPGVVWVAALLSALLSLNTLFLTDREDGSLDQLILSPQPLPLLVLGKTVTHWLVSGLPLVLVSPLIAITYQMPGETIRVMVVTLTLGTVSLSLLGSVGAALTIGLNRGTALLSLLVLPLAMPVLIFGARTVSLAVSGDAVAAGIYFLGAYCVLAASFFPVRCRRCPEDQQRVAAVTTDKVMWTFFHKLASPPHFYRLAGLFMPWFAVTGLLLIGYGTFAGLFVCPHGLPAGRRVSHHLRSRPRRLSVDDGLLRNGHRRRHRADLANEACSRRGRGGRADWRMVHVPGTGDRLDLGPADVGNLVGVGRSKAYV